jgi:hypothetical protein
MKIKNIYLGLFYVLISVLSVSLFSGYTYKSNYKVNSGIIKFSHKTHVGAVECTTCHSYIPQSKSLNDKLLPTKDVCAGCHDVNDENNCNVCHYEDVFEPLQQSKSGLYFSHFQHGANKDSDCLLCHKGIAEVNYASESKEAMPQMETCYQCHKNEGPASAECAACHKSTTNLIPVNHQTVDFKKNHKVLFASNSDNCAMCHTDESCDNCHSGTTSLSTKNTKSDFYTPYSPVNGTNGVKQQQLTLVHDLNYRYTHGIDVKSKSSECTTCHQKETFCVECHISTGGDYALGGVVPQSHTVKGFIIPGGYGSGGGEHSILAKRDIERCASCHDINGGDPNCIVCHTDNDGIKMTNPKTHVNNFLSDINGDWHNDRNSLCFTCHTDPNARPNGIAGVGFCGYCHGSK